MECLFECMLIASLIRGATRRASEECLSECMLIAILIR